MLGTGPGSGDPEMKWPDKDWSFEKLRWHEKREREKRDV